MELLNDESVKDAYLNKKQQIKERFFDMNPESV